MTFASIIEQVIELEGGLSMDPDDPGNWTGGAKGLGELRGTRFGISAKQFPNEDIKNLTKARAIEIYAEVYYYAPKIDRLPGSLQLVALDATVHHGPGSKRLDDDGGIRFLQRALGVTDDGAIGPKTVQAAESADPLLVNCRSLGYRLRYMTYVPTWSKNSRGFARRIAHFLINQDLVR
jgi:lysozyme family protein